MKSPHLHEEHEDSNYTSALHGTSGQKPCDQSRTCWCKRLSAQLFHRYLRYCRDNTTHEQLAAHPADDTETNCSFLKPSKTNSTISAYIRHLHTGKTDKIQNIPPLPSRKLITSVIQAFAYIVYEHSCYRTDQADVHVTNILRSREIIRWDQPWFSWSSPLPFQSWMCDFAVLPTTKYTYHNQNHLTYIGHRTPIHQARNHLLITLLRLKWLSNTQMNYFLW